MIYQKNLTCCITGHRPNKLPWNYDENKENCLKFKRNLKILLEEEINYGIKIFLTGMAEGFDMIATEILLELRNEYKEIRIVAIIPCLAQEKLWEISQQNRYYKILSQYDDKIVLSKSYNKNCMNNRNKYMVENSCFVIACYNGSNSGTGNTVKYGITNHCKIKIINPENYKTD